MQGTALGACRAAACRDRLLQRCRVVAIMTGEKHGAVGVAITTSEKLFKNAKIISYEYFPIKAIGMHHLSSLVHIPGSNNIECVFHLC